MAGKGDYLVVSLNGVANRNILWTIMPAEWLLTSNKALYPSLHQQKKENIDIEYLVQNKAPACLDWDEYIPEVHSRAETYEKAVEYIRKNGPQHRSSKTEKAGPSNPRKRKQYETDSSNVSSSDKDDHCSSDEDELLQSPNSDDYILTDKSDNESLAKISKQKKNKNKRLANNKIPSKNAVSKKNTTEANKSDNALENDTELARLLNLYNVIATIKRKIQDVYSETEPMLKNAVESLKSPSTESTDWIPSGNDTKWTLKHHGPGPGLVELMPDSGIYVLPVELQHSEAVTNNAADIKKFARKLLHIIFSQKALETCVYAKPLVKTKRASDVQPTRILDESGRKTLIDYAYKYAKESNWELVEEREMHSSLRAAVAHIQKKKN